MKKKEMWANKRSRRLAKMIVCGMAIGMMITPSAEAEEIMDGGLLDTITIEAERPDWEAKLSPGAVTIIRPDEYKGEQKTLPDMLRKVPGVHVREVNGKGQYTTVSVRGSTAAQVGVFVDGVLTNLGGDSAVDISAIPIDNVERIEVYRGYIPSRFAGTFIGGVINIVTKKPQDATMSAEVGKSSYGGDKMAFEYVTLLGDGTLMFGTNYESSDGDFRYKNYGAARAVASIEAQIAAGQAQIDSFNTTNIDSYSGSLGLSASDVDSFKSDTNAWVNYVQDSNGFAKDYYDKQYDTSLKNPSRQALIEAGLTVEQARNWANLSQDVQDATRKQIVSNIVNNVNPDTSESLSATNETLDKNKQKLKHAKENERHRKYNNYKNINSIVKWQNDNWMVKGSWNKIDRHLPDSLWNGSAVDAVWAYEVDLFDTYFYDSRRQKIDTKDILVQNRNEVGKLEWGWMAGYTKTDKQYRAEHIMENNVTDYEKDTVPLREWSRYKSDKYHVQLDGTYKMSERNMLDFQMNYSTEDMTVQGSLMDKVIGDSSIASILGQTRNRYKQEMLNIQLQDTITLDKKSSWFFTPSLRYNRSTITGYSDGNRFEENAENRYGWITPRDEQTDDKVTWQLALKKEFNDQFTMRMTGGTYYRLLNMYEIAGDGAGILPAPNTSNGRSVFPRPEEGKQFDISAIWNGDALGAYNKTTLTYFWRDSDNMLQLQRYGKDYWCYMNDNKGKSHGLELQSSFNWNKFDLDLQATYITSNMKQKNSTPAGGYDYTDVWATYQPEWEGNVRLTYRPTDGLDIFAEAHYTDSYYTYREKDSRGGEYAYLSGKPVDSLLVYNLGMKVRMSDAVQLTLGCNDIFNEGSKQKIYTNTAFVGGGYINPEFPIQGRTYYVTVRYEF